ncbi:MAG: hypothetical protein PVJ52_02245 [Candidatus Woesebacteria bacterium]|jgi:hypothetical protein
MIKEKGQAALVIIFVLGIISVLIGVSLQKTGYVESVMGRNNENSLKAFYIANSGVEEAIYRIQLDSSFGYPSPGSFDLDVGEGKVEVEVTGSDENERIIESVGTWENYVRRVRVLVYNTSFKPGFIDAIHAGLGGVEIRNNSRVMGMEDADGNVYSKSFIKGAKNDYSLVSGECKTSASAIYGSAYAVETITKLADNDSGVCVMKDANAEFLDNCFVVGSAISPNTPPIDCPHLGEWVDDEPPPERDLPEMGVGTMKKFLDAKGEKFSGDCILDGSGGADDCSDGTNQIGTIKIEGNLIKPQNVDIVVSGPVWVTGDIIFESNSEIALGDVTTSQMVVSDGKIESNSNISYLPKEITDDEGNVTKAFLLFISTYDSGLESDDPLFCDDEAISLFSNNNSVLFYSTEGCILVNANSNFHGAILGEGIRVDNNSEVEYDPDLQGAIFGLTKSGGWQTIEFEEY